MFIACGINHQTAPIHFREKFAVPASQYQPILKQLLATTEIQEITLLSTCNRTELYCETSSPASLHSAMADIYDVSPEILEPYWYTHTEYEGVKHALRVASGLDSMMLGEPQIFGQLKQAYLQACEIGAAKSSLKQIFSYVFKAVKRIRNLSGIGNSPISVAYAAAQRILNLYPNRSDTKICIIGSGDIAKLVTKYLYEAGIQAFFIASRTNEHAKQLADQYQATAVPLDSLTETIQQVDVVITASTCPVPFITKAFLEPILEKRDSPNLFLLDLAVPRNISEDTQQLSNITLCNIDELKLQCETGQQSRQIAAHHAEKLVETELEKFIRWNQVQETKHFIKHYRSEMKRLTEQELSQALQMIQTGTSTELVLEKLTHRLFKKLTHLPTLSLRLAAQDGYTEILELAQLLYMQSHYDT